MFERIIIMLRKEFIQVFRDPKMTRVIFVVPVVQMMVFGYAVTTDVRNITTALIDLDGSVKSREYIAGFEGSGHFDFKFFPANDEEAADLMDKGKVRAVIRINRGFEEEVNGGRTAAVQLLLDGTDSNSARIIADYAVKITAAFSNKILGVKTGQGISLEKRAWFNDNLESRNFYVPGVMAIMVMLITLMLTSMAIVREKEVGTIEQIMVTPIKTHEFIIGKTVPFAIIGYIDVLIVTLVGAFWFDIPVRGSIPLLFGGATLYIMTALGIGLLISTVSETQQQAMMSTFFFFFPAVLLSGFMFPIANMPEVVQWITFLNPLRFFLIIIRGIFLKGIGISILWPQFGVLALMAGSVLFAATKAFRKTVS